MRTHQKTIRSIAALSLLAALAGTASMAQAEQVWARVVSVTPSHETTGNTRYNVTYEYAGRHYTTVTDTRPGASIPIELGDYGVATTSPVAPQPEIAGGPVDGGPRPEWNNVAPEQGVVVSGGGAPAYAPAAVYAQPAPVYYPAPVYVAPAPAYYPAPYVYPPVGLSLNFGYSRGWRGHWR
ncbi:hypothetical protein C7T35_09875 [Variovorax sp. WS11]|uniref:hypothetical protein n=1 Tax=Variovorax sp. WS11 TaxID=1105204 RepID=UPI000D0DF6D6|nr:hypothetical protein [Variovorax sp. WS11]NDZ15531.1 hypothetical protein [Variovorax sp. WS11]PSL84882.1 hypothetical protein C7T35_09875 [Variovorax sp. WS11]